jgi:branched-chain amino acid transport system substrate-binding protein
MRKKINYAGLILLPFLLVMLVAGIAFATGDKEEVAVEEWWFPQITIMTGPAAVFGLEAAWGVNRAVEEINAAGGIAGKPVKVTQYDTAYDPAKAVQVMTQALGKKPLAIIGPMDQTGAEAACGLAVKQGVPFMTSLAAPYLRDKFAPWGCSLYPDSGEGFAVGTAEWIKLNPDIKSVVLFYAPASAAHVMQMEEQEKMLMKLGIEIKEKIEVSFGQVDLGPQAVKALSLNADGYGSMLNAPEYARMCKAFFERGMTEGRRISNGAGAVSSTLFEMGEGYLEGTFLWDLYNYESDTDRWNAYVDAYKAEHDGKRPLSMAIHGQYEAVYALKKAIEDLGITGDPAKLEEERLAIRDYLWNAQDIDDPEGKKWSYDNGKKVRTMYLYEIRNNTPKLIDTVEVTGYDY